MNPELIAKYIRQIANNGNKGSVTLYDCQVVSVNTQTETCTVNIAGLEHNNVRLTPLFGSGAKCVCFPKENTPVLVADLSGGLLRDLIVLAISESQTIHLANQGSNGGLINIADLVKKLNTIEDDLNSLKEVFSTSWTPVAQDGGAALKTAAATWAEQTITKTTAEDIEDNTVLH